MKMRKVYRQTDRQRMTGDQKAHPLVKSSHLEHIYSYQFLDILHSFIPRHPHYQIFWPICANISIHVRLSKKKIRITLEIRYSVGQFLHRPCQRESIVQRHPGNTTSTGCGRTQVSGASSLQLRKQWKVFGCSTHHQYAGTHFHAKSYKQLPSSR